MTEHLLVGTYADAGGPGLARLRLTAGKWVPADPVSHIRNASFGLRSSRHALWYFVDEQANRVGVYRAGSWQQVTDRATVGAAPCHLALDRAERHLAVANYASGSVSLFHPDQHGLLLGPPVVHQNHGRGPNRERQRGPHAHWVGFDGAGERLICVDLGADHIFALDPTSGGSCTPKVAFAAPPGSGPRHLAFHPSGSLAFLINELASTVTVLRRGAGSRFEAVATVSTLPADGGDVPSLGGAIALSDAGDRLYVSNRGHDSIAVFAVDAAGALRHLQHMPSGGTSPRFILLLEDRRELIVAHEQGGGVAIFGVAPDGRLRSGSIVFDIPGAAFLARDQDGAGA